MKDIQSWSGFLLVFLEHLRHLTKFGDRANNSINRDCRMQREREREQMAWFRMITRAGLPRMSLSLHPHKLLLHSLSCNVSYRSYIHWETWTILFTFHMLTYLIKTCRYSLVEPKEIAQSFSGIFHHVPCRQTDTGEGEASFKTTDTRPNVS